MASEDHGLTGSESLGDEGVGTVAGGGVEADVGLVEKYERAVLREDLGELGETQVRGGQVEGVGLRIETESGDSIRVANELPHRGFGELVRGALQGERNADAVGLLEARAAVEAGHRAKEGGFAGAVVAAQPHSLSLSLIHISEPTRRS